MLLNGHKIDDDDEEYYYDDEEGDYYDDEEYYDSDERIWLCSVNCPVGRIATQVTFCQSNIK